MSCITMSSYYNNLQKCSHVIMNDTYDLHVIMNDTYDYKRGHGSSHKTKVLVYNVSKHFILIIFVLKIK